MANPIDEQTAPSFQPIASRFRAEVGYGDTSSLQPSSLLPGDKIKYSPVAETLRPVAPVHVKAAVVANEARTVSAKPLATRVGRSDRARAPATIPTSNHRPVIAKPVNSRFKR